MRIFLTSAMMLFVIAAIAQDDSKSAFKKYPVGSTGCSVYLPVAPGEWKLEKSHDGSDVYTASTESGGFAFDMIVVQFIEPFANSSLVEKEALLTSYMDFLQDALGVTATIGYGKGQTLAGFPDAAGVVDYWQFDDESEGKVKGWISENHIAVLLVSGYGDLEEYAYTNLFLDGFRFP